MFTRTFMKQFPIRKYGDITARTGSVNTDMWLTNAKQIVFKRGLIYLGVTTVLVFAFQNWHSVDEMIGTTVRPFAGTVYERGVPKEVLYPNLEIIEGFEAINKMTELQQTLSYEK